MRDHVHCHKSRLPKLQCGGAGNDDQKTDGGTEYKQVLINAKLRTGKRGQKTELTERSPLRRREFALDCSAI
jgi:hypothetical protein